MSRLYSFTFDDGAAAGQKILNLISRIDPSLKAECEVFLSAEELHPFYTEIRRRTKWGTHYPSVEGLLSKLLKPRELHSSLITLWGADEFWDNQSNYAPICEVSPEHGIIQIGSWCGKSDGDAWVLDTEFGLLSSLTLGLLDYDVKAVRAGYYRIMDSPWHWFSFLQCEAWQREWIPELPCFE
jgi:hypothetical protein